MSDLVTLTIDGIEVSVPKGTLVVDAAKKVGIDIPVFCYHPKMAPVGMCRMCLVEIGRPMRDRASGELMLEEDGSPKLMFRGLETGCTVEVSEGMVVRGETKAVDAARENVIEFLLTSHPLDCPICDKGGECPLQNLTMAHGNGVSRFDFSDKIQLDKHVPLGELIYLDRERCIQCGRCVRFQDEIVADPVISFHNRGRSLEIATLSEPGFDSIWSGNTTDICPVGALTTADFRFGARPWELTSSASLCAQCPVGCNVTFSTRREAKSGGRTVIKRVMPRQNEQVNEIWICDKGRFVYHFAEADDRLTTPLVRKNGQLVEASWDEALKLVASKLKEAGPKAAGLANDRLSNEDLYLFQKLLRQGLGSNHIDVADPRMAGGDVVAKFGVAADSNLADLGQGDAILVVASDLHNAAPIWWLRVKQAAERGGALVIVSGRPTRLDKSATQLIHHGPGGALDSVHALLNAAKIEGVGEDPGPIQLAAETLVKSNNLVIFFGNEGLTYDESAVLAQHLANFLLLSNGDAANHAGGKNNGLIPVWPHNNSQGAWDMGVHPAFGPGYESVDGPGMAQPEILAAAANGELAALYLAGADPIGDGALESLAKVGFTIVQELFLTATAAQADVVLPVQSWAEREGTYTSGERRVQRFYPAIAAVGQSRADWQILAQVGALLDLGKAPYAAGLVFKEMAARVSQYNELSYRSLSRRVEQWPIIGRDDLYYGGTSYDNNAGIGKQWPTSGGAAYELPVLPVGKGEGLQLIHVPATYASGTLIDKSELLAARIVGPTLHLHATDAGKLGVTDGARVEVAAANHSLTVKVSVDGKTPAGLGLLQGTPFLPGTFSAAINKVAAPAAGD